MPIKYTNDYNGLRTAIQASTDLSAKAINKMIRDTQPEVLVRWINPDPTHPRNPSLLAIALMTTKPLSLKILKSLLSIDGVDVMSPQSPQGHDALMLLQIAPHLNQAQKHELHGLMALRGLPGTSPFVTVPPKATTLQTENRAIAIDASSLLAPPNTPVPEINKSVGTEGGTDFDTALAALGHQDLMDVSDAESTTLEESDHTSLAVQKDSDDDSDWQALGLGIEDEDEDEDDFILIEVPVVEGMNSTQSAIGLIVSPIGHVKLNNTAALQQMQLGNNNHA